jgi:hypothetical protein
MKPIKIMDIHLFKYDEKEISQIIAASFFSHAINTTTIYADVIPLL